MQQKMGKIIFLLCNLYISAVVGAGFATGQEIMSFFTLYGTMGFAGVLLSGTLFIVVGPLIVKKAMTYQAYSMGELFYFRFGRRGERTIKIVSFFLEFAVLTVMIAGLRTILQQMGVHSILAMLLVQVALFAVSFCKETALKLNNILTSIVLVGIIMAGILLLYLKPGTWNGWAPMTERMHYPWWISALLYAGFNLLLATPALCLAGRKLQYANEKVKFGGALGGVCICAMAFLTQCVLYAYGDMIKDAELPIVALALQNVQWFGGVYSVVIFFAMASSAVLCICCIVDLFPHRKNKNAYLLTAVLCVLAGIFSMVDFSRLIELLYPVFGALGVLAMVCILW